MLAAARTAARLTRAPPRARPLSDAAKKRDPTLSNDIRRRVNTALNLSLAQWRSQVYAAIVEADQLGYEYGEVDPEEVDAMVDKLDILLRRGAEFNFNASADQMDVNLRTAYGRGVARAGGELTPVIPSEPSVGELALAARANLEDMLDDQIVKALRKLKEEQELALAALESRHKLYTLVLLPLLLKPLQRRLKSLSTTEVTRLYNAGKIDAYEELGIAQVGVLAETQPESLSHKAARYAWEQVTQGPLEQLTQGPLETAAQELAKRALQRIQPPPGWARQEVEYPAAGEPTLPEGRLFPSFYTVETVGDDRVCDICEGYEGNAYSLDEARALIPAHPNCRCSIVPLLA